MTKKTSDIYEFCLIGLTTAIICVIAPLSIPLPIGVPMTLQTFIITLIAIILGAKRGATATLIYILLGAFGLPVFSNYTGGWQTIVGPTGGFILSFPLMAYIIGFTFDLYKNQKWPLFTGLTIGTSVNFICGMIIFCIVTQSNLFVGLTTCVFPFIPIAIIKVLLAYMIGIQIKCRIKNLEIR